MQIKVDLDAAAFPSSWVSWRLQMVCRYHRLRPQWVRIDKTRRGWHVVVQVRRRLSAQRVVMVQALLGSDWKRELFNSARVFRTRHVPPMWRDRWNVLFTRHQRNVQL